MVVTFSYDKKNDKVFLNNVDVLKILREKFSIKRNHFERKINPLIPERKYFIPKSGKFALGFLPCFISKLRSVFPQCEIELSDELDARLGKIQAFKNFLPEIPIKFDGFEYRDYQNAAYTALRAKGWGISVIGTGGGKTLLMASLAWGFFNQKGDRWFSDNNFKILVSVTNLGLVDKTLEDFLEYGIPRNLISVWTGKNKLDRSCPIVICNHAIMVSQKDANIKWMRFDVKMVIADEIHELGKENESEKIIKSIKTPHKFGFTGTLPKEDLIDKWNLFAIFGPTVYSKSARSLRKEEYLANAEVVIFKVKPTGAPDFNLEETEAYNYRKAIEYISEEDRRNTILTKILSSVDGNFLLTVDRIEHGETLKRIFESYFGDTRKIYFIQGSVAVSERARIIQEMENSDNCICIAMSRIFSTGINIKNLPNILLGSGGRSEIKVIQTIGRGLRKHEQKEILTIFDVYDDIRFLRKQAERRIEIYKSEHLPIIFKDLL